MGTFEDLAALREAADFESVSELDGASVGYYVLGEDLGAMSAGQRVAAVEYHDTGIIMTPADWQGPQPDLSDPEDVAATRWQDEDGRLGMIEDGLPVKALAWCDVCGVALGGIPSSFEGKPTQYTERCECGAVWQWAYWAKSPGDRTGTWEARRIA